EKSVIDKIFKRHVLRVNGLRSEKDRPTETGRLSPPLATCLLVGQQGIPERRSFFRRLAGGAGDKGRTRSGFASRNCPQHVPPKPVPRLLPVIRVTGQERAGRPYDFIDETPFRDLPSASVLSGYLFDSLGSLSRPFVPYE